MKRCFCFFGCLPKVPQTIVLINLLVFMLVIWIPPVHAGAYWVSPTGSANWADCQNIVDPGSNYCGLGTANVKAIAGDTVYLKGGTYALGVAPVNSGSGAGAGRIIFQAATGETPVLTGNGDGDGDGSGVYIGSKSWIKVDGITAKDCTYYMVAITGTSAYNEITNCEIYNTNHNVARGYSMWSYIGGASTHTWFHGNTVHDTSKADGCADGMGVIQFGSGSAGDNVSDYNTIEDNTFYHGGHHTLQTFTHYNIIRNNNFRNDGFRAYPAGGCNDGNHYDTDSAGHYPGNRKYGHRNIEFQSLTNENMYVLIEGNRVGYASMNPANNGDEQLTLSSSFFNVRYNAFFGGDGQAIYFKNSDGYIGGQHSRIYNNTMYGNGQWNGTYHPSSTEGILNTVYMANYINNDVKLKNNLLYQNNNTKDFRCNKTTYCVDSGVEVTHNFCVYGSATECTASGDPKFVSTPTVNDTVIAAIATSPNLNLQSNSPAIDGGTFLTQANGAAAVPSFTLIVDDAKYFQDGTWGSSLSNVQADWICIGTVTNCVQISKNPPINYANNTISLATAKTWADNAPIWLYKKSDGKRVLNGAAPDYGAYEYDPGIQTISPPFLHNP